MQHTFQAVDLHGWNTTFARTPMQPAKSKTEVFTKNLTNQSNRKQIH